MNLTKLFEMQRVLDERIIEQHGLQGKDLLPKKILALQVELGELAQEWRGFKFWSKDQQPRYEKKSIAFADPGGPFEYTTYPLLEEYIDCIHFILSIGITTWHTPDEVEPKKCEIGGILQQFLSINKHVGSMDFAYQVDLAGNFQTNNFYDRYDFSLRLILGLGEMLGFTWDQIEEAYMSKNAVNHERQSTGY